MKRLFLASIAAAAAALAACSSQPQPQPVTLTAQTMTYVPATFEISAGAPVELTLDNQDTLEHDWSIIDIPVESVSEAEAVSAEHAAHMEESAVVPALHVAALPGETGHLTFTPTRSGTYEFYCTVPGHKDAGMVGTMTVLAP
jgi:uncharacterized cupredoxin-like copper-binding protein